MANFSIPEIPSGACVRRAMAPATTMAESMIRG
jgi:hypothetical protein